jgi:hypothetical protein
MTSASRGLVLQEAGDRADNRGHRLKLQKLLLALA